MVLTIFSMEDTRQKHFVSGLMSEIQRMSVLDNLLPLNVFIFANY